LLSGGLKIYKRTFILKNEMKNQSKPKAAAKQTTSELAQIAFIKK